MECKAIVEFDAERRGEHFLSTCDGDLVNVEVGLRLLDSKPQERLRLSATVCKRCGHLRVDGAAAL